MVFHFWCNVLHNFCRIYYCLLYWYSDARIKVFFYFNVYYFIASVEKYHFFLYTDLPFLIYLLILAAVSRHTAMSFIDSFISSLTIILYSLLFSLSPLSPSPSPPCLRDTKTEKEIFIHIYIYLCCLSFLILIVFLFLILFILIIPQ